MKEPLPPGAGPSEEHSLCQTLCEAAAEDQRQPALHSTALTPSSLLPCLPRGESTRNPRAREPRRGREWICGEGGTSAKNTHLEEGGSKKGQGDSEEMAARAVGYFLSKEEEGRKNGSIKQRCFLGKSHMIFL